MSSDPQLGAIVEIPVGRGVVRFAGATSFAAGKWVGIELNEANGKNNGTINDIAYFTCKPNYGVFVRPSQVKVIGSERDLPPHDVRHKAVEGGRTNNYIVADTCCETGAYKNPKYRPRS
jgi:dynactin 1